MPLPMPRLPLCQLLLREFGLHPKQGALSPCTPTASQPHTLGSVRFAHSQAALPGTRSHSVGRERERKAIPPWLWTTWDGDLSRAGGQGASPGTPDHTAGAAVYLAVGRRHSEAGRGSSSRRRQ